MPRVGVDDAMAVDLALGHLQSLGHQRIGVVVGPAGHVPSDRKVTEFLARVKGPARELVAHTLFSMEGGQAATNRLLAQGATAVVCASDALALGAIRAARKQGLDVPGDLSVIGFDDSTYMAYTDPPLTTLRQPIETIGAAAVASLVAQIDGRRVALDEQLYDPELIVRDSTGPVNDAAELRKQLHLQGYASEVATSCIGLQEAMDFLMSMVLLSSPRAADSGAALTRREQEATPLGFATRFFGSWRERHHEAPDPARSAGRGLRRVTAARRMR